MAMTPAQLDFSAGPVPENVLYVGPVSGPDPLGAVAALEELAARA